MKPFAQDVLCYQGRHCSESAWQFIQGYCLNTKPTDWLCFTGHFHGHLSLTLSILVCRLFPIADYARNACTFHSTYKTTEERAVVNRIKPSCNHCQVHFLSSSSYAEETTLLHPWLQNQRSNICLGATNTIVTDPIYSKNQTVILNK